MKRNFLSMLLGLALLFSLASPAQAACYGHWVSCNSNTQNTCEGCGEANVLCEIIHDFSGRNFDSQEHWSTCRNCSTKYDVESHFALCFNPTVCDLCGATGLTGVELGHPNFVVKSDAQECWGECIDCGTESFRGSHYTFCTDQGKCSYCGYPGTGFAPYHEFETFSNGTHHWKECSECGKKTPEVLHNAPCTAPDRCQECGAAGALVLSHTEVVDEAVPPTCTEDGLTEGKHCVNCSEVLIPQGTVSRRFHNWQFTSSVPATCTEAGATRYTCNNCGYYYVDRPAALGHNYDEYLSQQDGTHMAICSLCNQGSVENCRIEAGKCALCGYVLPDETNSATVPCVECENGPIEGISLEVVNQTQNFTASELPEAAQNAIYVFQVALKQDGLEIAPQGNVIIRLPIEKESSLEGLKLMLVQKNGTLLGIAYEIQNSMIVFKTDKTGTFVFLP